MGLLPQANPRLASCPGCGAARTAAKRCTDDPRPPQTWSDPGSAAHHSHSLMLHSARDPRTRISPIACSSLRRGLPQAQMAQRAVDPQPRELFLHAVLVESRAQIVEIHAVEVLVLVEAGEHHAFDAACGVAMHLQALGADF